MLFLDVSSYQGSIDFKRARAGNHDLAGVWIKATEGLSYTNPYAHTQALNARAAGLRVGFYHFARLNQAAAEAAFFARVVKPWGTRRDLKPVLDLEVETHLPAASLEGWARNFNHQVRALLGVTPIFYSYAPYIQKMRLNTPIGNGLWLASYGRNDGHPYPFVVPAPWKRTVAHQFSSQCRVAGCTGYVDLSSAKRLTPLLAHPIRGSI